MACAKYSKHSRGSVRPSETPADKPQLEGVRQVLVAGLLGIVARAPNAAHPNSFPAEWGVTDLLDHAFEMVDIEWLSQDLGRTELARLVEESGSVKPGHENDGREWMRVEDRFLGNNLTGYRGYTSRVR
jgi:hypothetical protein